MRGPRLPPEELAPYVLNVPLPGRCREPSGTEGVRLGSPDLPPLSWRALFGNDHPVELEVGFGKGLFLLTAARMHPEINYVGVEIVRKYQLFTATRLAKRGLRNVRVVCADVLQFLPSWVAAESLQVVHVYFPDPWWKKRHHKRRIFTSVFVNECIRVLRPGGQLHAATDVEEYAQVMTGVLAAQPALRPLSPPAEHIPSHDLDYLTNFERKFRKQGKPIFRMRYQRSEVPL